MSDKQLDTLILMVNQISMNNQHYTAEEAAGRIAKHLKSFWARSMKQMIISYSIENGSELSSLSKLSIELLSKDYPEMTRI
jgi:formate dehydrogenase subunit delta